MTGVDQEVYVRTWYRRDSGWFGLAIRTDAAYRTKYGRFGDESVGGMVNASAAATTLHLRPAD